MPREHEPGLPTVRHEDGLTVYRVCPKCKKFLKAGKAFINGMDQVKLVGWICKTCGEVRPDFEFFSYED